MDTSTEAPFRFRKDQEVSATDFCVLEDGGIYTMDISKLIAHVVPHRLDTMQRYLSFYWDFPQTDHFVIDLHFSMPVEVMDLTQLQASASTANASYIITATRIAADHVRVESRFTVSNIEEQAYEISAIGKLCAAAALPDRMLRIREIPSP